MLVLVNFPDCMLFLKKERKKKEGVLKILLIQGNIECIFQEMTSIISSHHCNWSFGVQENLNTGMGFNKVVLPGYNGSYFPSRGGLVFSTGNCHIRYHSDRRHRPIFSSTTDDGINPDDSEDPDDAKDSSPKPETGGVC